MSLPGAPAFPAVFLNDSGQNAIAPDGQLVPPKYTVQMTGLTKREYFAAMAMQGLLANGALMTVGENQLTVQCHTVGGMAVAQADVLIAELAKAKP